MSGNKVKFIALEGNTGSGKSTVLQLLSTLPGVEIRPEPVEVWQDFHGHNLLQLRYDDPKRWSFTFQTMVQLTRLKMHSPTNSHLPFKIMERSLHSNRYCFLECALHSKQLTEAEFALSTEWFQFLETNFNIDLDLIVYLRTSPELVFDRIKKRNRAEEKNITLEQLQKIDRFYEDWIMTSNCQVVVIDANQDWHQVSQSVATSLASILTM